MADRNQVQQLARAAYDRGDPIGWFEELYAAADGQSGAIPWADMVPNPGLVEWCRGSEHADLSDKSALVVACGLGDDAEQLAATGARVTAFDISETAIAWCRRRFNDSTVHYCVRDLLSPPPEWVGHFDFVFEACTLQALPWEPRRAAIETIASLLAPGGKLLVITRGRDPEDPAPQLPWPLTRSELQGFEESGLQQLSFEDYTDDEEPPVRRFRVVYRQPAS